MNYKSMPSLVAHHRMMQNDRVRLEISSQWDKVFGYARLGDEYTNFIECVLEGGALSNILREGMYEVTSVAVELGNNTLCAAGIIEFIEFYVNTGQGFAYNHKRHTFCSYLTSVAIRNDTASKMGIPHHLSPFHDMPTSFTELPPKILLDTFLECAKTTLKATTVKEK